MSDADTTTGRIAVPAIDEMLGRKIPALDDGFVRVVDYMGSDAAIVQAARVSYGAGTKHVSEDRGLIRYLMRHRHTTPFEMCEIKLHVRVPMDCWRQWIRHRTASVNEYSTRYSVAIDAAQATLPVAWRAQSQLNRQGSGEFLAADVGAMLSAEEAEFHLKARQIYEARISLGVAREQARKDLPLATYTEAYWKINLHNLLHFLNLRMDRQAQAEIREYASIIGHQIVAKWCPDAWQAFEDYTLQSMTLNRNETDIVRALAQNDSAGAINVAISAGIIGRGGDTSQRNRERDEVEVKITNLGFQIPWRKGEPTKP